MGSYRGAQAELLRVPFADFNCTKLQGSHGEQWEDDFVMQADVFSTGFFATMLVMVMLGLPIAVFGQALFIFQANENKRSLFMMRNAFVGLKLMDKFESHGKEPDNFIFHLHK